MRKFEYFFGNVGLDAVEVDGGFVHNGVNQVNVVEHIMVPNRVELESLPVAVEYMAFQIAYEAEVVDI